ncbi:PKD domain-containing protein [Photobacterium sanguinicancri]|uniref:PKD domain-containing protein n=1 Tax=Photobacterium sanguinicancri TaxID=875932 RepID=UPI0024816FD8|nr:PKD domain-containing protein [Photobacterium sanguinicancri]
MNWDKNVNPKRLIITPTYDWVDGPLEFTISMLDRYGNENQESFQFEVEVNVSIRSIPSALPSKGEAPLSVTFTPTVKTDSAINLYRWDFNGDGQYERTDTVGRNQNHTFTHPGAYRASLEITDSAGRKDVGLVQVNVKNGKPVVTASVDKTNGRVPLTVNFSSNATDNEGIESVEWDFDGDGSVDYHHSSAGKTSYVYETPGSYQAKVIVTDKLGASTQLGLPNIEIRAAEPDAPEVMLNINKTSGKAPLSVVLSASFTHDKSVTVERMLWDFDGDGLTDATDGQAQSWVYRSAGTFYPSVTLVTSDGKSAKDVRKLAVQEQLTLTVEGSTLDPDAFDLATIHTTLNADMDVSLVIEDSHGAPVRTLVSWVKRGAGDYADKWDGSSNLGQILPQGDYYAVLKYRRDGQEYRLDLRPSTSGGAYNPRRNYIPSRFQPYDNNPLTITFTLPYPSEVTSFMGLYNTNTRLVTFSNREPLGAGTHTIVWNGIGDDGKPVKATSSNPFLFGIWGYKSGDNAIYIASGPKLSGFSANPAIAVPETHTDASDGHSHLQFTLTKPADIELVVSDNDTGLVVRRHIYQGAIKGEQNLRWDLKSDDGKLVSAGKYRLGLRAIDAKGFTSPYLYTVQRVYY